MFKKLLRFGALALFACGALSMCDNFNVSLDEYIEDATGRAQGAGYTILTSPSKDNEGVVVLPPADAASVSALEVALHNPRNYELTLGLEGFDPSLYGGLTMSASADGFHKANIQISGARHGDEVDATLTLMTGDRPMSPYKLPKLAFHYLDADLRNLEYELDNQPGEWTRAEGLESGTTAWAVATRHATNNLTIRTEASQHAKVTVNGTEAAQDTQVKVSINPGPNEIKIEVNSCPDDGHGVTKTYTLTVDRPTDSSKEIKVITIEDPTTNYSKTLTEPSTDTISVNVPAGTNPESMSVTIEHNGASVTLDGGEPQGTPAVFTGVNFSGPKIFRVTARDTTTRDYTVQVNVMDAMTARTGGTEYTTLYDALAAADAGSESSPTEITILQDITAPDGPAGTGAYDITGKHIRLTAESGGASIQLADGANHSLFNVASGASLTLGKADGSGGPLYLDGGGSSVAASSRRGVSAYGKLVMYDNTYIQNFSNTERGGGVHIAGGNFIMYGGTISGNSAYGGGGVNIDGGSFEMQGGIISSNIADTRGGADGTQGGGGGVYLGDTGTFQLKGGTIKENTAYGSGGGVHFFGSSGTFTMSGGSIDTNTAYVGATAGGGGVAFTGTGSAAAFNISGGSIVNNTSCLAGGVYVSGKAVISGTARISGNHAEKMSDRSGMINGVAGGVFVTSDSGNGNLAMTGGEISNNDAEDNGGGIFMTAGTFTMSGGEISGNTAAAAGGGIYLNGGDFTMSGGIVYGSADDAGNGNKAVSLGDSLYKSSTLAKALYDSPLTTTPTDILNGTNGGIDLTLPVLAVGGVYGGNLETAITAANGTPGNPVKIAILEDITASASYIISGNKNIQIVSAAGAPSTGYTITAEDDDFALFDINSGATLTLGSEDGASPVILDGNDYDALGSVARRGVSVQGTLFMNPGVVIQGFLYSGPNSHEGGGVGVLYGGSFTMNGGEIKSNKAARGGGVLSQGTFIMKGGTIYGASADSDSNTTRLGVGASLFLFGGTAKYSDGTNIILSGNSTDETLSGR